MTGSRGMHRDTVIVDHREPSIIARIFFWAARLLVRPGYRWWPLSDRGIGLLRIFDTICRRLPAPDGVVLTETMLGGVRVERSTPRVMPRSTAPIPAGAMLYLHGGGFLFCSPATHRFVVRTLAVDLDVEVYSVDYRQLPVDGVGGSVTDAYAAFCALRSELGAAVPILLAGDSAGGFLAAKVCELAHADGIAGPAAVCLFSPLVDLDLAVQDGPWRTRDALQPAVTVRRAQGLWNRGPTLLRGARTPLPDASAPFPPTMVHLAENELLEPSILAFTDALRDAGTEVSVHRWSGTVHAFPVLDRAVPESARALELSVEFLRHAH